MVWIQPLLLTLQLSAVAVGIAAVIGIVGAWSASILETGGRAGRFIARLFLVSMLGVVVIPMILHAAAWEATAGKFGWMWMTGSGARSADAEAYGFFNGLIACGWIHGVVGAAMVALATWYGVRRTPSAVLQQGRLDVGPVAAWWQIRLPIAAPWLVTSLLATALLAATEMTVVNLYGYRSIADEFYLFYAVNPSLLSILNTLFVPLGLAAWILTWMLISRRRLMAVTADHASQSTLQEDAWPAPWHWLASLVAISIACLVLLVPVSGLIVKIGHEVTVQNDLVETSWSARAFVNRLFAAPRLFASEYQWTAILATLTGSVALLIAWPLAAMGRTHPKLERWMDPATVLMVILPGPVVALAVVSLFQTGVPGFRILYQQTLLPTMMALLVRAVPIAYWILRAGYRGIATPIFEASRLDESTFRRIWSIDLPLLRRSLVGAFLAATIFASGDVPATLPVLPPGVTTVGTRLFGLLHSGARYQEAALALWYVGLLIAISLVLTRHVLYSRVKV